MSDFASDAAAAAGAASGAYTPREPRQDRGGFSDRRGGGRNGFEAREYVPPAPTNGIYVGNLLFDVTAADLEREFGSFGKITSATIASDARGLSKG